MDDKGVVDARVQLARLDVLCGAPREDVSAADYVLTAREPLAAGTGDRAMQGAEGAEGAEQLRRELGEVGPPPLTAFLSFISRQR